jgi:glycosyltransferase involved in cell wall biosynthesis
MARPLSVGLNLAYLVEDSGGSGRYARELIAAMLEVEPDTRLTAWVGSTAPADLQREPWAAEVEWVRLPVPGVGSPWHLWHELIGIGLAARRRRIQVVHGLAYLAPVLHPGVASIATILDVIWMHHPEAAGRRFRLVMRTLTPLLGRTSNRIIAISQAAREDIATTLRLDPGKIDVTPLGIDSGVGRAAAEPTPREEQALRERLGLDSRPVVLCVAAKRPHKNLHGLVRAFALLHEPRPQLVLPGSPNDYERELRRLACELGVQGSVRFPGWISDEQLQGLYRMAACFVLPTFQEGFGLPVLEAMARGVPVACSNIPTLHEVAGNAALLFDPHSPRSIAHAIEALMGDQRLCRDLVKRGHDRCATFTWRRTAETTLASYRRALQGR